MNFALRAFPGEARPEARRNLLGPLDRVPGQVRPPEPDPVRAASLIERARGRKVGTDFSTHVTTSDNKFLVYSAVEVSEMF